jgi:hypothetical protein
MADLKKIKEAINEIAGSRGNVTIEQIEWVVSHLHKNGKKTGSRPAGDHQILFTVEGESFGVCTHHKNRQLKRHYVNEFIKAMIKLGLYEEN